MLSNTIYYYYNTVCEAEYYNESIVEPIGLMNLLLRWIIDIQLSNWKMSHCFCPEFSNIDD